MIKRLFFSIIVVVAFVCLIIVSFLAYVNFETSLYDNDVILIKGYFKNFDEVKSISVEAVESWILIDVYFYDETMHLTFLYKSNSDLRIFPNCYFSSQTLDNCFDMKKVQLIRIGNFENICGYSLSSKIGIEAFSKNPILSDYIIKYKDLYQYISNEDLNCKK